LLQQALLAAVHLFTLILKQYVYGAGKLIAGSTENLLFVASAEHVPCAAPLASMALFAK
jgi:hypothetical protein